MIGYIYNDGGRAAAGFKGSTGDCVCRAIAIAAERPYKEVYDLINEYAKAERISKRRTKKSNARTGVRNDTAKVILSHYGFRWVATMEIGRGCRVHLRANELPKGRIVCALSGHYTAVIDGTINDTYDCSRDGTRCVYGYFVKDDTKRLRTQAYVDKMRKAKSLDELNRVYRQYQEDKNTEADAAKRQAITGLYNALAELL